MGLGTVPALHPGQRLDSIWACAVCHTRWVTWCVLLKQQACVQCVLPLPHHQPPITQGTHPDCPLPPAPPQAPLDYLDPGLPASYTILGYNLVVWRDTQGAWRAMDDRCPHRNAPLSGGQPATGPALPLLP